MRRTAAWTAWIAAVIGVTLLAGWLMYIGWHAYNLFYPVALALLALIRPQTRAPEHIP